MSDLGRILDDEMGKVCQEIQEQIDNTMLDRLTKGRAKEWLEECVEKGRQAREQHGDGRTTFNSGLVPLKKHIEFFGKAKANSKYA